MADYSFRGPRSITELLDMMDKAKYARSVGVAADPIEDAIRVAMARFDPESVRISSMLRDMSREPVYSAPVTALNNLEVPAVAGRLDDMDLPTLQAINKSNNSFQALRSGRTLNLRNNNTPLNRVRQDDILTAAQDNIRGAQEAAAQEAFARKLAAAALTGGGLMVGDSLRRMSSDPMVADETVDDGSDEMGPHEMAYADMTPPQETITPLDPMDELLATDIPIDEPELPVQKKIATDLPSEQLDLVNDDPMATADLAEESRPLPASTPKINIPAPKKPPMTAEQAALHFSSEAQQQINRLNQYRRQGIIDRATESQMLREIQHLHGLANEARRSASPLRYQR